MDKKAVNSFSMQWLEPRYGSWCWYGPQQGGAGPVIITTGMWLSQDPLKALGIGKQNLNFLCRNILNVVGASWVIVSGNISLINRQLVYSMQALLVAAASFKRGQTWWGRPVTPRVWRPRQEDCEFEDSGTRPYVKANKLNNFRILQRRNSTKELPRCPAMGHW